MQTHPEKKKRTSTSGSRSKSKKSTNNIKTDQTVELKPKSYNIFYNQDICAKVKTENSLSLNKSKPGRKTSKTIKRPDKQTQLQKKVNTKQSKQQSYLVSAQRKHSVNKITKTQATHLQSQDIYKKLYSIKKQLTKMKAPVEFSISEIEQYFNQIKQSFANIAIEPLQSIFQKLHMMYITPIENFLNIIRPYESILKRKEEVSHMIKQQMEENQKLYQQLDPEDIEIIQLKDKIKKNAEIIEEMKRRKKVDMGNFQMKKKKGIEHHEGHPTSKAIGELSNRDELISERISQNQNKLVQEYEKPPVFQYQQKQQRNSNGEKKKTKSFTQALQHPDEETHDNVFLIENEENQNIQSYSQQEKERNGNNVQQESQLFDDEEQRVQQQEAEEVQHKVAMKSAGASFSFKLDLPRIDRTNPGFHDEFYSKLDQFSESWRNQALRQKRF